MKKYLTGNEKTTNFPHRCRKRCKFSKSKLVKLHSAASKQKQRHAAAPLAHALFLPSPINTNVELPTNWVKNIMLNSIF